MGEISITKLLAIAVLVVLLFGSKKLASLGGDLATALKGFKKAINGDIPPIDADFLSDKKSDDRGDKSAH